MKSYTSVLLLLAASLVAAAPGPLVTPAPVLPRQNAAANDGSKGIEAADLAQEAVDLASAGDIGAQTSGAVFSSIDAQVSAKEAQDEKTAIDAATAIATQAAVTNNNKNGASNAAAAGKKGANGK